MNKSISHYQKYKKTIQAYKKRNKKAISDYNRFYYNKNRNKWRESLMLNENKYLGEAINEKIYKIKDLNELEILLKREKKRLGIN